MKTLNVVALTALLAAQALPSHAFDGIRVTLLGTGTPELPQSGPGPSTMVETGEEILLFDCGPGTRQRLEQAGVPLRDVTALFLSTLDARQLQGCRELLQGRAREGGGGALPVWGPAGTVDAIRQFEGEAGIAPESAALAFEISDNVVYQPEGLTVTAFVTDAGEAGPSFGYRVDALRRAITVSGSTRYSENVIRYARGAHVLVHEVAAASAAGSASPDAQAQAAGHTSPEDAARVFRAARPYLAVYSHKLLLGVTEDELVRRTRNAYRGLVEVGRDLMVIEVQNEVQIRSAPSEPRASSTR
jgi:ribonuclease Z